MCLSHVWAKYFWGQAQWIEFFPFQKGSLQKVLFLKNWNRSPFQKNWLNRPVFTFSLFHPKNHHRSYQNWILKYWNLHFNQGRLFSFRSPKQIMCRRDQVKLCGLRKSVELFWIQLEKQRKHLGISLLSQIASDSLSEWIKIPIN